MIRGLVLMFVSLVAAQAVVAQSLTRGNWRGEVTMHGEQPTVALFRVQHVDDADPPRQVVTMFYNERPYSFEEVRFDDGDMRFTLDTGVRYDCRLKPEDDGSYRGRCRYKDEDGETRIIRVSMSPPGEALEADAQADDAAPADTETAETPAPKTEP